ncbi:hypothetical protein HYX18_01510 [Candidatus Woesearchaeota archaeon]|nr:hypothetical protein [Candidatus Woesearchaeota archaeon]
MIKSVFFVSVVSFTIALIIIPWLIKYLKRIELFVIDQNKEDKPLIPISGGIAVAAGILVSFMTLVFVKTFFQQLTPDLYISIFAVLVSLLTVTFIGFIDDVLIKKSRDSSYGLKQWQKPLLTIFAAIPLIAVKLGVTKIYIPFFGSHDVGLLYPMVLVPLGFIGATNMVNLLAGFNGSEAGMGLVYTGMLGLYAFLNGSYVASALAFSTFSALLVFFYYNKYPAKILPGDSLTYLLGAVIACIAIVGNMEKAALIASIPFIIEFILKARSKFKAQSYGFYKDGRVQSKYEKIYSIPHILTRTGKFTEKQVSLFMIGIELFFASLIWIV